MDFPNGFPTKARARVKAEQILAYRKLDETGKNVSSGLAVESLVRDCILRIFLVFADELCAFGQENGWAVDRIDSQAKEFLRRLTIEVQRDKGYGYVRMISNSDGSLTGDAERQFLQSPKWKKYESSLLRLARLQQKAPGTTGSEPTDRRAIVDAYIEEVRIKTGRRIYRKAIWIAAGYKTRTEFERWERRDTKHPNKAADENFTRILREKPHLK